MLFRKNDRKDKERHELAAASRIRSIGGLDTHKNSNPEEVNRRLRNMSYGSTDSRVAAIRG